MSTRTRIAPHRVINAQSMAASITSEVTILQSMTGFMYQASWSGTSPVGTLSVQVSNDYSKYAGGSVDNPGTWTTIALQLDDGTIATSVPVSGNTGSDVINVSGMYGNAVRLVYTFGSGVGTMSAYISGKVA